MATEKQINANRNNAKKSTGPRTKKGKAIASRNSLKHGLLAKKIVIHTESKAEFELHCDEMLTDLKPVGPMESILAQRIITLSWRLKRSDNVQAATINTMDAENAPSPLADIKKSMLKSVLGQSAPAAPFVPKPVLNLGRLIIKDFSNARVIDRLSLIERRIEDSLQRTMDQFYQLKFIRQMNPPELSDQGASLED